MEGAEINPSFEGDADLEKKKLKEKIKEILDFPLFDFKEKPDINIDPKSFYDSNPSLEEKVKFLEENYTFTDASKHALAELCFVIIREQPAFDSSFIFSDEDSLNNFLDLIKNTGVMAELIDKQKIMGKLATKINFARKEGDLEKMKSLEKGSLSYGKYSKAYGELMGFPETAIQAYLGETERLKIVDKQKSKGYGQFVYSKEHAEEEQTYFMDRNTKLKEYAPQLFE